MFAAKSRMLPFALVTLTATTSLGQSLESVPINLEGFLNADGWIRGETPADDPLEPTDHPDFEGSQWGLDASNKRALASSLPASVVPGRVNRSADGEVGFLLPTMDVGELDIYFPTGDRIPVPRGKYQSLHMALLSGSGTWGQTFEENNWGPEIDPVTNQVLDARSEMNSFRPVYTDGPGEWIPIQPVNDWFWPPTVKPVPASGNRDEVVLEYLAYDKNLKGRSYRVTENWDGHNGGQYTNIAFGAGDEFFSYFLDGLDGLTEATLWLDIWGNSKISISTDDENYTEIFNSVTSDQAYPDEGKRYYPNRQLKDFDLAPYIEAGDIDTIFLRFEDAAVDTEFEGYGPRMRYAGIFTGPVELASSGDQIWPSLVREDGSFPNPDPGGLVLIERPFELDETRTLEAIMMPNNLPRAAPILNVFAMTLGTSDLEFIDVLSAAVRDKTDDVAFDLNGDGLVDDADRVEWVKNVKSTWFGDSNFDGVFGSSDLVAVFQAGHYEDDIELNSGWAEGDWNGDGDFTSGDLVVAFQDGGYEQGPRPALAAVPEPNGIGMMVIALVLAAVSSTRRRGRRF